MSMISFYIGTCTIYRSYGKYIDPMGNTSILWEIHRSYGKWIEENMSLVLYLQQKKEWSGWSGGPMQICKKWKRHEMEQFPIRRRFFSGVFLFVFVSVLCFGWSGTGFSTSMGVRVNENTFLMGSQKMDHVSVGVSKIVYCLIECKMFQSIGKFKVCIFESGSK